MPDTGAPWNIPYVAPTDLVRDYPQASEDLADAVAAGLTAAGGLVEVKSVLFTGTQTNSTASGANFAVTNLTITHTLADAANTLIIHAFIGVLGSSGGTGNAGMLLLDDSTLIGTGAAEGSRSRLTAGGRTTDGGRTDINTNVAATFVYAPGDAASHVYTVRAVNLSGSTETLYINRQQADGDAITSLRGASGLVIQEIKV
jgi:hypothetical protein